jgi:hypothetical protein
MQSILKCHGIAGHCFPFFLLRTFTLLGQCFPILPLKDKEGHAGQKCVLVFSTAFVQDIICSTIITIEVNTEILVHVNIHMSVHYYGSYTDMHNK